MLTADASRVLCTIADLKDPGSRAFSVGEGDWPLRGFVILHHGQLFAYVNRCPHAGHPLNWQPHEFFTVDKSALLCASHGARFDIATGHCFAGPCVGRGLTPIGVHLDEGYVVLNEDPNALAARFA